MGLAGARWAWRASPLFFFIFSILLTEVGRKPPQLMPYLLSRLLRGGLMLTASINSEKIFVVVDALRSNNLKE